MTTVILQNSPTFQVIQGPCYFNPLLFQPANFPAIVHSRIAPTPSGFLHLGNAYNFLLTERLVRAEGGRLRLRIDDGDAGRARPEYIADIFESLAWLGIVWEDGPRDASEQAGTYSQSLQGERYAALLARLKDSGRLYACTCSRREAAAAAGSDGQYAGTCRKRALPLDTPGAALRLHTPEELTIAFGDAVQGRVVVRPWERMRDFVVWRREGLAAYQLTSVADDLAHKTDLIVRGEDLLDSTAAQLWLAQCAGLPGFAALRFVHHPLLTGADGEKLSKSAGSSSLRMLRESGLWADELRAAFALWRAGWSGGGGG